MSTYPDSTINSSSPAWALPEALAELLGAGDDEFLAELIEVFKSQTRVRIRQLREAVENGRMEEARAQAHAIKGGSSQVGADRLAAVCFQIERGTASGSTRNAALVSEAEFLFEETCRLMALPPAA
jgi:HPt (histidine-containing phosphotransfer) domain-containing protein